MLAQPEKDPSGTNALAYSAATKKKSFLTLRLGGYASFPSFSLKRINGGVQFNKGPILLNFQLAD
jgi:hypothetical protein